MDQQKIDETRRDIERNQAARQRQKAANEQASLPLPPAEEMQMATYGQMFGKTFRSLPNEILRSALYGVMSTKGLKSRKVLQEQVLPSMGSVEVIYTGEELDTSDGDVTMFIYSQAICDMPGPSAGTRGLVKFTSGEALEQLRWPRTGPYYRKLAESLVRQSNASIRIHTPRLGKINQLKLFTITEAQYSRQQEKEQVLKTRFDHGMCLGGANSSWTIEPSGGLFALYSGQHFSRIDIEVRAKLRSPLAKWIHGWLMSFSTPFPINISQLMLLSRTESQDIRWFRKSLRAVMVELVALGVVETWDLSDDKLTVIRAKRKQLT